MKKQKFKWNPAPDATDESLLDVPEEETQMADESPLNIAEEEEIQMADDMSPVEQFISWPLAEDTPEKGENPVASIEATPRAPTAKELARLNRFPPA